MVGAVNERTMSMDVSKEIARLRDECADRRKKIKWLVEHQKQLEATAVEVGPSPMNGLDFDHLPHAKVISVVRSLGGKWKKTPTGDNRIHYTAEIDGMTVRCYAGEPPPSCKLVEVEVHVPAQVIPAHTVKKMKMVCHPSVAATITASQGNALPGSEVPF
jgi:hypothetical protein